MGSNRALREDSATERRRRKLFKVARNEIGLTDDERIDLAQFLLRRDVTSWKQLSDEQVCRMLDALEGYQLVDEILRQRT